MRTETKILFAVALALFLFPSGAVSGIGSLTKNKKITVYESPGVTNLKPFQNKSGVYLIYFKDETQPIYIGESGYNLYKTITRHFQSWTDGQTRVTYPQTSNYKVRIVTCSPSQAKKLERALIVKHNPRDNPNKYENYILNQADKNIVQEFREAEVAPF